MNPMQMHHLCKQHIGHLVTVQMNNNEQLQGFIEDVDDNNVYMMVPENSNNNNNNGMVQGAQMNNMLTKGCGCQSGMNNRQFFGGYGGYGGYPGGGYYPRPRPRYRRLVLPLAALVALSTLF
ncbi:hypothetical protein J2S78_002300 [Salibacterium salarium]|uniref:hypothetical protein n=1 Tax=Salibacterium salarium TaxID=284579 RepID=UPI00278832D6|nr:hypothetical protein [Salibacterium salarium]MDQ0299880.1 hypothetical protein [Salibacterium salarium]